MRALLATFFALATTASGVAVAGPHHGYGPGAPHGGPPPAQIRVDNEAGVQVDVWIDGVFRGQVRLGDERGFTTTPGRHDVRVVDPWGTALAQQLVVVTPSRAVELDVRPLLATVRVRNDGHAPLFVTLPGQAGFWLLPGAHQTVQTLPGPVPVSTAMYTPRGLEVVGQVTVNAQGGRLVEQEIGWFTRPPTSQITLVNDEPHTLRVYVGGLELAAVPPGATRTFDVTPGRQLVTVVEHGGRVLYNDTVVFDAREDHRIHLRGGRGFASAQIVTTRYAMR